MSQEIYDVLRVCGISKHVANKQFIDSEGFTSLEDFGVMDREMDVPEMTNHLSSRAVATHVNLGKVQTKEIQALVWWIHDCQIHNHPLIVADFGQVTKWEVTTGK